MIQVIEPDGTLKTWQYFIKTLVFYTNKDPIPRPSIHRTLTEVRDILSYDSLRNVVRDSGEK